MKIFQYIYIYRYQIDVYKACLLSQTCTALEEEMLLDQAWLDHHVEGLEPDISSQKERVISRGSGDACGKNRRERETGREASSY